MKPLRRLPLLKLVANPYMEGGEAHDGQESRGCKTDRSYRRRLETVDVLGSRIGQQEDVPVKVKKVEVMKASGWIWGGGGG
jgi:hypothetical protein